MKFIIYSLSLSPLPIFFKNPYIKYPILVINIYKNYIKFINF